MIPLRKTLSVSLTCGFILSLMFWCGAKVSDELGQHHISSFVAQLLSWQRPGHDAAARWFPCKAPQATAGCESYKVVPVTILVNGIVYAGVLLPIIFVIRRWSATLD